MHHSQAGLATLIRYSSSSLAKVVADLGDQFTWKPLDKGRSAHDQTVEVGLIYLLAKHIVETGEVPPVDWSYHAKYMEEHDTPLKTVKYLEDAAELLANVIEVASDERLEKVVTLPFGGGIDKTVAEVVLMAHWNTVYHEGQVNYIQTILPEAEA